MVGGVAGHYAGHHAVAGALGGCIVGHHMAKVNEEKAKQQQAASDARAEPDAEVSPPHALLLSDRSALGSSGQRGRAGAAKSSIRSSRNRSTPRPGDHRAIIGA